MADSYSRDGGSGRRFTSRRDDSRDFRDRRGRNDSRNDSRNSSRFDSRDDSRGDHRGGDRRDFRDEQRDYRGDSRSRGRDDSRRDRRWDSEDNRDRGGNRGRDYGRGSAGRRRDWDGDRPYRSGGRDQDRRRGGYQDDRDNTSGYSSHRDNPRKDNPHRDGSDRHDRRGNNHRDGGRPRRHAQRGGKGRADANRHSGPQRQTFREERMQQRLNEPVLPDDVTSADLDSSVLQDLRSLSKDNADRVGRHMVMAATLMQDDPQLALRHARAAKDRAGRVAVVRETCGIAAYHAGEWKEALSELRTARRMTGGPGLIAVMADCERGLGRPDKALEIAHGGDVSQLDAESRVELAIVASGARQDMGQFDAAVTELEALGLDSSRSGVSASRLFYAYADALVAAGRAAEAQEWFSRAAASDEDGLLDAEERLRELDD